MKRLNGRLGVILIRKKLTLRKLAMIANKKFCDQWGTKVPIDRKNKKFRSAEMTEVIQGKRNTKRYVELLESTLGLDIATIRKWYKEDKGKKLDLQERKLFADKLDGLE